MVLLDMAREIIEPAHPGQADIALDHGGSARIMPLKVLAKLLSMPPRPSSILLQAVPKLLGHVLVLRLVVR